MYSYIKEYYILGLYQEYQLNIFVSAKWINEEEKQEIINSKTSQ
ncbi:XkdX family protein [Clostridium sp. VAP52]|nr:XkdX family protein [Clostridium sp. VAP52]